MPCAPTSVRLCSSSNAGSPSSTRAICRGETGRWAAPPTHEEGYYSIIRHSNDVFAAFKVHTMGMEMASKLHDADGELKPFSRWLEDISFISSYQVESWL